MGWLGTLVLNVSVATSNPAIEGMQRMVTATVWALLGWTEKGGELEVTAKSAAFGPLISTLPDGSVTVNTAFPGFATRRLVEMAVPICTVPTLMVLPGAGTEL